MQKYLAILEDKIQYVAILLGVLFVLLMVGRYVLKPPAEVTVDNENLTPGEVDDYAVIHAVNQFQSEIEKSDKIDLKVPKHVQRFKDQMSWKESAPTIDMAVVYASQPKDITLPQAPQQPGPNGANPAPGPGAVAVVDPTKKVTALPVIPAPTPGDHRFGRSLVIPPPAAGAAAPAAPPAPVAPGAIPPDAHDQDWVTQVFKVNLGDIDKAFTDAKIPPGELRKTLFLQVMLEREELDPDGKPIKGTLCVIPPLQNIARNAGTPPPPYPTPGNMQDAVVFLQWAAANQPDIIEPLFYSTVPFKGDQWQKPGELAQNVQAVFDPATFTGSIESLTDQAQKDAVMKYRRDKYKADQDAKKAAHPAAAPHTGPPAGGPGMEGGGPPNRYAPAPPSPAPPRAVPPGVRPPGLPPTGMRPPGRPMEGDIMDYPGAGGPGAVAAQVPGLPTAGTDYPNQDFDPGDPAWKTKTVEIWAHDTTVQAGKTYHYRIKYKIKNPLFGTNAGVNAQLNNTFDLTSADNGPWASPFTIPEQVNLFVASSKSPNGNSVRFDVFKWEKGQNLEETFSVGPGDQIGGVKQVSGQSVDFGTDWTIVDFRFDDRQRDWQVLLLNNKTGKIETRSFQADQNDALYKGLKEQIKQNQANQAPGAQAGVGTP